MLDADDALTMSVCECCFCLDHTGTEDDDPDDHVVFLVVPDNHQSSSSSSS